MTSTASVSPHFVTGLFRKFAIMLGAGMTFALAQGQPALAQDAFPSKLVRMVIPYPPGGPTDLAGRLIAQDLSKTWKQSVLVDNRPGASGSLGSAQVAKSAPDGYTLVLGTTASHGSYDALNPKDPAYQTLRDFAPIVLVGTTPQVMIVSPRLGAKTAAEFVNHAKRNPGKLNYASTSIGGSPHLAFELLKLVAGIDVVHIPFNGNAPAIQAMVSGTVDAFVSTTPPIMGYVREGKAYALAATSAQRIAELPDIPTLKEQGFDAVSVPWYALFAPAKTPDAILDRINADVNAYLSGAEGRRELLKLGFDLGPISRAAFNQMLRQELDTIGRVVREARITAQ